MNEYSLLQISPKRFAVIKRIGQSTISLRTIFQSDLPRLDGLQTTFGTYRIVESGLSERDALKLLARHEHKI